MKRSSLIIACVVGIFCARTFGANAAGPTEAEQRSACLGDALRLCAVYVPDRARIRACLGAQHAALSETCRLVYDASVRAEALAASHRR